MGRSPRLEGTDVLGGEPPAQDLLQVNNLFVCKPNYIVFSIIYCIEQIQIVYAILYYYKNKLPTIKHSNIKR